MIMSVFVDAKPFKADASTCVYGLPTVTVNGPDSHSVSYEHLRCVSAARAGELTTTITM